MTAGQQGSLEIVVHSDERLLTIVQKASGRRSRLRQARYFIDLMLRLLPERQQVETPPEVGIVGADKTLG